MQVPQVRQIFMMQGSTPAAASQPQVVRNQNSVPQASPQAPSSWLASATPARPGEAGRSHSKGPHVQDHVTLVQQQRPAMCMDQSPCRRSPGTGEQRPSSCMDKSPCRRSPGTGEPGFGGRSCLEGLEEEVQQLRQHLAEEVKQLRQYLGEDVQQLRQCLGEALEKLSCLQRENAALKVCIDDVSRSVSGRVAVLERGLVEEVEARCDLDRGLGKDLRSFVKAEMEHSREMMVREMRERMDGQKVLREEVQLQQQNLAGFTGRVDEFIIELRTELPRLGQENAALQAALEKLSDQHAHQAELIERLEKGLAEEGQERQERLKSISNESREHLAQEMLSTNTQLTDLRKHLNETNSRIDGAVAAFGKELREKTAAETECVTAQVADLKKLLNELRLRSDVASNILSKDLRDHVALEVERMTAQLVDLRRLIDEQSSRAGATVEALGKELREHVVLESKDLREHIVLEREQKEKEVAELRRLNYEAVSRIDAANDTLNKDLRDYVALEAEHVATQILELKNPLDELAARADGTQAAVQSVSEHVDQLVHDLAGAKTSMGQTEERLLDTQSRSSQQVMELAERLHETDATLQSWVKTTVDEAKADMHSWAETTIVNRMNSLDRGLRTEMAERSSAIQQVASKVSLNAERWCQLQAKFDEIFVEFNRTSSAANGRKGPEFGTMR